MFRFYKYVTLLSVLCAMAFAGVIAQDTPIAYGDVVTGEITNRNFEIGYVFSGEANDVVVIVMDGENGLDGFNDPALILLDPEYNVIADTEAGYGDAILPAILPASGDYTVLATRKDGRAGEGLGMYTLWILSPEILKPGEPVAGTAGGGQAAYYTVVSSSSFGVTYTYEGGNFRPKISINSIQNSSFDELLQMSGDWLDTGRLGVGEHVGNNVFVVIVGEPDWYYSFDDEFSDFTIELGD